MPDIDQNPSSPESSLPPLEATPTQVPPTVDPLPQPPTSPTSPEVKPVFPSYEPTPPASGPETAAPSEPPPPVIARSGPNFLKFLPFLGIGLVLILILFFVFKFLGSSLGLKKVTLTYWGLWEPESVVKPIIDKYQKDHPGVTINYVLQSPKDYRERLTNSLAEGKGPDIFRFHNTWVPMLKNDLSPVPAKVYDAASFQKTFYPVAKSDLVADNKILGIPIEYDGLALFYNTDIFQKAGKTPPKDWNDVRKVALDLTVRDELGRIKTAGVALGTTNNVDHWQDILALMMLQNNVDLKNPIGKNAEDALTFYTIFSNLDHVWDDTLPNSTAAFLQGRLAMYFGPSWRVFDFEEAKRSANPGLNYAILPVPQLPDTNITWASYWAEGVARNSKNADAAWSFVNYLSQKDTLQTLFTSESQIRKFGEPYGRVDMAGLLQSNPIAGAFVSQAPNARSWYLASRTGDGPTGINSRISKYFEDAIGGMATGNKDAATVLKTAATGVTQVLVDYKLIAPPPVAK